MNLTDIKMVLETPDDPRLGRRLPSNFNHVEKYRLTAATLPAKAVPVVVGVNWYADFDRPVKDSKGRWWVGKNPKNLGGIRGGHCVCMPHRDSEPSSWYLYYNQGSEGACVGFGSSRAASLMNRKMYDPRWLWNEAKKIDEWPDTNPGDNEGTSVRAAMDVLRLQGHVRKGKAMAELKEGIEANRWATTIDQLFEVLQNDSYKKLGAIPFFNSWGRDYPRKVWMPCETWERLMKEYGEFTLIVDK